MPVHKQGCTVILNLIFFCHDFVIYRESDLGLCQQTQLLFFFFFQVQLIHFQTAKSEEAGRTETYLHPSWSVTASFSAGCKSQKCQKLFKGQQNVRKSVTRQTCLTFQVGHCQVAVISDSRSKQLLKQIIMAPAPEKDLQIPIQWVQQKNIERIMHPHRAGKIQVFVLLYKRVVCMLFNIQYDTSEYLCSAVSNYKVCHSSHTYLMVSLFSTVKY